MSKTLYLSPTLGTPILMFIWKWKLCSTAAIAKKFFSHATHPSTAYNFLQKLKTHRYISIRTNERGENPLWTLDKSGFQAIQGLLPALKEEGYLSEHPHHDWMVSAFHLGEWLVECPGGVVSLSEQELRRYEPEYLPGWAPKDPTHRPDGYWHRKTQNEARTLALEVEVTPKKIALYQHRGTFYGENAKINRVLWVVGRLSHAKLIEENLNAAPGSRPKIHSFTTIDSFFKKGWGAEIVHGPGKGIISRAFIQMALGIPGDANTVPGPCPGNVAALLETRIKRIKSATSGASRDANYFV